MSTHVHVACCEVLLLRCSKEEYEPLHDMLGCSSRHSRSAASCLGAEHPGKMGGFAPALRLQPRLREQATWLDGSSRAWRAACKPASPSDEAAVARCRPPKMALFNTLARGVRYYYYYY